MIEREDPRNAALARDTSGRIAFGSDEGVEGIERFPIAGLAGVRLCRPALRSVGFAGAQR